MCRVFKVRTKCLRSGVERRNQWKGQDDPRRNRVWDFGIWMEAQWESARFREHEKAAIVREEMSKESEKILLNHF